MNKTHQRVEFIANILIILVAISIIGFFLQKFFNTPTIKESNRLEPRVNAKVELEGVNWSSGEKTLVLVLQTGCKFCHESIPFYRRLNEKAKGEDIQLIAVFPTSVDEGKAYLIEYGLTNIEVKQSPLSNVQVGGTPTLILTNKSGEITDFWVGKLPVDKETEVIDKLFPKEDE